MERLARFKRERKWNARTVIQDDSSFLEEEDENVEPDENVVPEDFDVDMVEAEETIEEVPELIIFEMTSSRGERGKAIWDKSEHKYLKNKRDLWYCQSYRDVKCQAKIRIVEIFENEQKASGIFINDFHNHPAKDGQKNAEARKHKLREKVKENPKIKSRQAIADSREGVSDLTFMEMPSDNGLRILMGRERKKVRGNIDSADLLSIVFTDEVTACKDGSSILLYDSREHRKGQKDVVMIFVHQEAIEILKKEPYWHIDGTFKASPKQFKQVFVIGVSVKSKMVVCGHALLPGFAEHYYLEVFEALKSAIKPKSPKKFMSDFEMAEINAIRHSFPLAKISLCYFHFANSMWRKYVDEHLDTKKPNETEALWDCQLWNMAQHPVTAIGQALKRTFRSVLALPLMPVRIVRRAFALILATSPPGMENFLFYIAKNYIGLTAMEKDLREQAFGSANYINLSNHLGQSINYISSVALNSSMAQSANASFDHGYSPSQNPSTSTSIPSIGQNNTPTSGILAFAQTIPRWQAQIVCNPRYEIQMWNLNDRAEKGIQKTNNSLEVSHFHFSREMNFHPTLSEFIAVVKEDATKQLDIYRSIKLGKTEPRKTRNILKEKQIIEVLEDPNYDTDEAILGKLYELGLQMKDLVNKLFLTSRAHRSRCLQEENIPSENSSYHQEVSNNSLDDGLLNVTD